MGGLRLAVVTGGTGAIGGAIARGIAGNPNFELLLLVRDATKGQRLVNDIRSKTANMQVRAELVDVSLQCSIRQFASRLHEPVHVLINNAAVAPHNRQETSEGREVQFATNVLGYYRVTLALVPNLEQAIVSRVVNVASYWAGDMDLEDLEFKRRRYDSNVAYRQSKQANRMLTVALAARLAERGICVNACHPGDVNSTLSHALGFGGSESPEAGARTPLWLATSPQVEGVSGGYFADCREASCRFSRDRVSIDRLVEACRE